MTWPRQEALFTIGDGLREGVCLISAHGIDELVHVSRVGPLSTDNNRRMKDEADRKCPSVRLDQSIEQHRRLERKEGPERGRMRIIKREERGRNLNRQSGLLPCTLL